MPCGASPSANRSEDREVDYRLRDIRQGLLYGRGLHGSDREPPERWINACFDELFQDVPGREEIVTLFIALLELLKLGKAYVTQNSTFDQIILHPGRRQAFGVE